MKKILRFVVILAFIGCSKEKHEHVSITQPAHLSIADSAFVTEQALKTIHHFDVTGNLELSKQHIDSAKQRLVSSGFGESTAMSAILNLEAVYWERKTNDRDTAIYLLKEALSMAETELGKDHIELSDMMVNLGFMYKGKSRFDSAAVYIEKALLVFDQDSVKYADNLSKTLLNLADLHSQQDHFAQALPLIYRAERILIATFGKQSKQAALVYAHLASLYFEMEDFDKALEYRRRALEVFVSQEPINSSDMATTYNALGLILSQLGDHQGALNEYKKAEKQFIAAYGEESPRMATIWDNIALQYEQLGDYQQSLSLHLRAQKLEIEHFGVYDKRVASGRRLLARTYNRLGKHQQALKEFKLAKDVRQQIYGTYSDYVAYDHRSLSETYRMIGNMQLAYAHLDTFASIRDSILTTSKIEAIAEMSGRFESDKKDNEISILNLENEKKQAETVAERNKRVFTLGISGLVILMLLGGGVFIQRSRKQKHQVEITRAELQKNLVENDFLRSQLDPHFIKNALFNIEHLLNEKSIEEAQRYTDSFNKLMNITLENSRRNLVGLDEELEMMRHYLALEADRLENRLSWFVHVADDVNLEEIELPPMILQPLVENALKHGADMKNGKGEVKLEVRVENERIVCIVEDNGGGIDLEKMKQSTSHGLRITRERLEMFSRLNLADAKLEITNTGGGTRAVVSFAHV
jgi:tetratricopeptide (TPR) repeat protein